MTDNTLNAHDRDRLWSSRIEGWSKSDAWTASLYIEQLENELTASNVKLEQTQQRLLTATNLLLDKINGH